jgi:hypothetical protein
LQKLASQGKWLFIGATWLISSQVWNVLRKIITKDGYEGTDNVISSETHKACSGNSGHQNQLMVFPEIVTYLKVRSRLVNVYNKITLVSLVIMQTHSTHTHTHTHIYINIWKDSPISPISSDSPWGI